MEYIAYCGHCESYPCNLINKYVPVESESRKILDEIYESK